MWASNEVLDIQISIITLKSLTAKCMLLKNTCATFAICNFYNIIIYLISPYTIFLAHDAFLVLYYIILSYYLVI